MPNRKLLLVTAAALIDSFGRILLAQRPSGKQMGGLWEFPGGKIEPEESPEDALVRELQEELGIVVAAQDLQPFDFASHAYDTFHLLMPLYLCRKWQGDICRKEHQAFAWLHAKDMQAYPLAPADIRLAEALCRRL